MVFGITAIEIAYENIDEIVLFLELWDMTLENFLDDQ